MNLKQFEVWFVAGSQRLYGPVALKHIAANAREVAGRLNAAPDKPLPELPVARTAQICKPNLQTAGVKEVLDK